MYPMRPNLNVEMLAPQPPLYTRGVSIDPYLRRPVPLFDLSAAATVVPTDRQIGDLAGHANAFSQQAVTPLAPPRIYDDTGLPLGLNQPGVRHEVFVGSGD